MQSPNYQIWRNPLHNPVVAAGAGRGVCRGAPVVAAVHLEEEEAVSAGGDGGVAAVGGAEMEEDDDN